MNKSNIADMAKKIDVNGIVSNIKSMINPTAATPNADADDVLGLKLAEISTLVQSVAHIQAEQTKAFAKLNKLVNAVYADVEALRCPQEAVAGAEVEAPVVEETK